MSNEQYSIQPHTQKTPTIVSILVIDDQQANGSNKPGLTPSPSSTLQSSNTNVDSTNGLKFLMVPGQNAHMSGFSSGKKKYTTKTEKKQPKHIRCARYFVFVL